jgi:hypothetical protein
VCFPVGASANLQRQKLETAIIVHYALRYPQIAGMQRTIGSDHRHDLPHIGHPTEWASRPHIGCGAGPDQPHLGTPAPVGRRHVAGSQWARLRPRGPGVSNPVLFWRVSRATGSWGYCRSSAPSGRLCARRCPPPRAVAPGQNCLDSRRLNGHRAPSIR